MSFLTRPHIEDRQFVQYVGEFITLSGFTNFASTSIITVEPTILDFTGTTTASTITTISGLSGYINNDNRTSGLVVKPPVLLLSGTTGTTTVDVTGYVLKSLDSQGTVYWDVESGGTGTTQSPFIYNPNLPSPNTSIIPDFGSNGISTGSTYSSILGGAGNEINSNYSSIAGGAVNLISGGQYSGVGFGKNNRISGSTYSTILGGYNNEINNLNNTKVIGSNIVAVSANTTHVNNLNIYDTPQINNGLNDFLVRDIDGQIKVKNNLSSINPYYLEPSNTSITWNVSGNSTNYETILTGNTTLNLINVRNGDFGTIIVKQDAVGNRLLSFGTVNGGTTTHRVINGGGGSPTLTGNANAIDILTFTYNGTILYWTVGNDYT